MQEPEFVEIAFEIKKGGPANPVISGFGSFIRFFFLKARWSSHGSDWWLCKRYSFCVNIKMKLF